MTYRRSWQNLADVPIDLIDQKYDYDLICQGRFGCWMLSTASFDLVLQLGK
jgi:hypothetical protein